MKKLKILCIKCWNLNNKCNGVFFKKFIRDGAGVSVKNPYHSASEFKLSGNF
jgi:hypothetical protein